MDQGTAQLEKHKSGEQLGRGTMGHVGSREEKQILLIYIQATLATNIYPHFI